MRKNISDKLNANDEQFQSQENIIQMCDDIIKVNSILKEQENSFQTIGQYVKSIENDVLANIQK